MQHERKSREMILLFCQRYQIMHGINQDVICTDNVHMGLTMGNKRSFDGLVMLLFRTIFLWERRNPGLWIATLLPILHGTACWST